MYLKRDDFAISICLPEPYKTCHEVNFVKIDDRVAIIPTGDLKRRILNCGFLEIGGREYSAKVQSLNLVAGDFRAKYGDVHFEKYFGGETDALMLETDTTKRKSIYRILESEFDQAAADYDIRITTNPVERYMRSRTSEILRRYCKPGSSILDIGCGTLRELSGLQEDVTVTCAELSDSMILEAKRASNELGIQKRVEYLKVSSGIVETHRKYDIVFSSFGYIDLENMGNIAASVTHNLKESGVFIGCFWNRHGMLDLMLSLLKGKFAYIRQKTDGKVYPDHSRFSTVTFPKNASAMREIRGLKEIEKLGICLVVPPYHMTRALRLLDHMPGLYALDRFMSRLPLIKNFSDYMIVVMRMSS
ncbi:MAG: class I SAM-dependent methyltransferase [Thermoplasmata archaeon]